MEGDQKESGIDKLPNFKTNWETIKSQIPTGILPFGWSDTLDKITYCWKFKGSAISERVGRLSSATALEGLPKLERRDALEYLENSKKQWGEFSDGINAIVKGEKLKWDQIQQLADVAEGFGEEGEGEDEQATALLEVLNRVSKERKLSKRFRQKIAQHAFDEVFQVGDYRAMDYTGADDMEDVWDRTTQDPVGVESNELLAALNKKLWTTKERKERRKTYLSWRRAILDGDNSVDEEVADDLEKLWNAAYKNEATTRNSALHFLQLGEDIYKDMEEGGAFDIDITEYREDEDDEDSEEDQMREDDEDQEYDDED